MSTKQQCVRCKQYKTEPMQMSASPNPDGSGIEVRVVFQCKLCHEKTVLYLDGILVTQLSEMVDQVIEQMREETRNENGYL
jgi:hypothetical protein